MNQTKIIVRILLSGMFVFSGSLYALVGTAIRRIVNYGPKNVMLFDSNGNFYRQGPAQENMYGVLIPTQTDYHKTNDPEIKQNEETPASLYLYTQDMYDDAIQKENERVELGGSPAFFYEDPYIHLAVPNYSLSDYDWRIWLVENGKRTYTVVYDKQYLKEKYRQYRIDAATKSLEAIAETIKGAATGTMPNINLGALAALADRPPTKDLRLYVMPDDSIIFTANYEKEKDTPSDMILKDLIEKYDGDPNQDYSYLYKKVLDEVLREEAYKDALNDALKELN